jgi:amino acid transporter/nucleotide-binding universal stress UspA family protein
MLIDQVIWGTAPTWTQLVYGISIGTVAYTGIETVSNMAEEAANPYRDVPKAINYVLIAVLAVYLGISMTALSAMPVEANVLPLNAAKTESVAMPVVAKNSDQPNGPFVFVDSATVPEGNPVALDENGDEMVKDGVPLYEVYVDSEKLGDGSWQTKPLEISGEATMQGDQPVSTFYATQLGSVYREDPVVGIVLHLPASFGWLESILLPWVGILAATILVIATNAGIIGVSRLAYSLGQHRQVPPILGRVHPRRMTPYIAIMAFGGVACLLLLLPNPNGTTMLLADLYAFGAMISFTVAHISVVRLRFKEPDVDRPFRTPLNIPLRGRSLPLLAVLGGLGTFTVWVVVVWTHDFGRWVGLTWMVLGFLMYVIYRKKKGYSLTKTVEKIVLPDSVTEDIDYNQILVPIVGSRITDEMVVLACQLATEKQSALDVMYVIEVPMHLPLDARLTAEREQAERVLRQAALVADSFKVPMNPIIITARQAGRAIVEQALERRSEVIILGAIRKRRFTERALGGTIDYVMSHAPCEVLINLVPAAGVYADDAKRRSPTVSMETLEAERRAAEDGRRPPQAR